MSNQGSEKTVRTGRELRNSGLNNPELDSSKDSRDTGKPRDKYRGKRAHQAIRRSIPGQGKFRARSTPRPPFTCVCGQNFARIEHLRRHVNTVHSDYRIACKVPGCTKSFSRSDNLYDHYCTHVDLRKSGRNRRLSLKEMEGILGSQDRSIFLVLRRRMSRPRRPSRSTRRRH
ncbi:hypothetical protein BKA63DRAFT_195742 [Paraphoma chrysanthemicola]|nr:hypothetical protein BKA63DRAFT_195742 [Paraphoma chrysanthemicola]